MEGQSSLAIIIESHLFRDTHEKESIHVIDRLNVNSFDCLVRFLLDRSGPSIDRRKEPCRNKPALCS